MTGTGPEITQPQASTQTVAPASSAGDRAARFNAANMVRSLVPLVVIILLFVGWNAFQESGIDPVTTVDPSSTVQLAASRANYPLVVPSGLPQGYRSTSARTDAGRAQQGDPVTLRIGYVTPSQAYAGFAESDDPRADALTSVLNGAQRKGAVDVAGTSWTRSTTRRGETVLWRTSGTLTVLVTGSASERELERVAGAVRPYSG
jgi:hypothetical protein